MKSMVSMINNFGLKVFSCCLFLSIFLMWNVAQARETKKETPQQAVALQRVVNDLKKAIKIRNFSALKYDVPEKKPLSWGSCGMGTRVNLSFDEMINNLSEISTNINIIINETPVQLLYITTIETKGWKGESPYLYFEFKEAGDSWRWLGTYECNTRSSDFQSARNGDLVDPRGDLKLQSLISHLKKATQSKDFKMLWPYVPEKKVYYWAPCGPGDSGYDELSFEAITEILLRESKDVEIYFNPKPEVDLKLGSMSIETEGWLGEHPFFTFSFDLLKTKNRWVWSGVCYSETPELKLTKNGRYEATYFRKPLLPRPGPRIFSHYSTLRARIAEIVKFREFEVLRPYAIKGTIVFEQCSRKIIEKDRIEGKEKSVDDVINFLKKRATDAKEIKFSGVSHNTYYETIGWSGEYPVIAFWFNEGKDGWEWAGVSYCKTKHAALLFPNEPAFK